MVDKVIVAIAALAVLGLAAFFAIDRYIYEYGINLNFKVLAVIAAAIIIAGALALLGARSNRGGSNRGQSNRARSDRDRH